jgi:2,3-diketo-5-methylthio-1-phosphopentane phosphatase
VLSCLLSPSKVPLLTSSSDAFKQMLDSVAANKSFDECRQIVVDKIELDPGFKVFLEYCLSQDIPVIVLSGGMEPLISALLQNLVGPNEIPIVSNGAGKTPQGTWEITYHDDSGFGHDKSLAIKPFTEARKNLPEGERPTYFYCGDGVSDLSAAKETDLLFAKEGHGKFLQWEVSKRKQELIQDS